MHSHRHVSILGRRFCIWCLVQTMGFPVEHLLWEKAPGFAVVTHLLGL